jgi:type IV pilus assembly protein PilM
MASPFGKLSKLFALESKPETGSVIGIDFGSSSIKVVQVREERGGVLLETYGELQLGPYASVEIGRATNLEPQRLAEALRDIMREASVTTANAGIAIPYVSSFVTVITVPTQNDTQLSAIIPIEARKYVPVPVNQVTLDWFVVPQKKGQESSRTRILLAAIHNEALSKYKTATGGANVASAFSEIEIFSTIRSSVARPEDTALIVDMGAATTKLYVVSGGLVQATHSMTVGGQELTQSLAKALELPQEQAEELKRQVGLSATDNPRIERALSLSLERIAVECRRFLDAYERTGAPTVATIILSGGGATLKGIDAYMHNALGRTVVHAEPFLKVGYPAFLEETLKEIGPSFSVAVGVALRRLGER